MSEKEPTVSMSLKSWNNFDRDLSLAEHQLVSALTNVRLIRNQINSAMGKNLKGRVEENLVRVTELEESVKGLRKLVDEVKAKEKMGNDKDREEKTTD